MKKLVKRGKKMIPASLATPLRKGELAEFLDVGRSQISADCARGYAFEYGTMTRPRHYLAWLAENPKPTFRRRRQTETTGEEQRMKRQLEKLC